MCGVLWELLLLLIEAIGNILSDLFRIVFIDWVVSFYGYVSQHQVAMPSFNQSGTNDDLESGTRIQIPTRESVHAATLHHLLDQGFKAIVSLMAFAPASNLTAADTNDHWLFELYCLLGFASYSVARLLPNSLLRNLPVVHILNAFGQFSVSVLLLTSTSMNWYPDNHFWNITISIIFSLILISLWQTVWLSFDIHKPLNLATKTRQRLVIKDSIECGMGYCCGNMISLWKAQKSQDPRILYNLLGFMCFYSCHLFTHSSRKGYVLTIILGAATFFLISSMLLPVIQEDTYTWAVSLVFGTVPICLYVIRYDQNQV